MGRATDRWRQAAADRARTLTPLGVRRRLVKGRLAARHRSARWRVLPDFLVIGGQRCGTSSLYKWLGRHPDVVPSLRKEIEFFSLDHWRGEDWYRAHFPLRVRRTVARVRGRRMVTFEATPDYLFDPRAPERAHRVVPHARLVALLREPGDRAVSHYHHAVRLGFEPLGLREALEAEGERLAPEWHHLERHPDDPGHRALALRRHSYLARGRYAEQLQRWLRWFPRRNLLVVGAEELFSRPAATFRRITEFLGLSDWQPSEFRNYSYAGALDGSYPAPPPAVRALLTERFAEPNARLAALLGEGDLWETGTR